MYHIIDFKNFASNLKNNLPSGSSVKTFKMIIQNNNHIATMLESELQQAEN
jgi:hypothetical protein